ncbi:hypothetical protein Hanom_Chr01g00021031 [Helianthus anomalus]
MSLKISVATLVAMWIIKNYVGICVEVEIRVATVGSKKQGELPASLEWLNICPCQRNGP